jgi:predicted ester cyclase
MIEDQFAEGDQSVVRWIARGTHQGAFQGIPTTGKPASVTAITLFGWANGRAAEAWTVFDQMSLLQ